MTQEQLRMQMLASIITESEYKAKVNEASDESYLVKNEKGDIIGSWYPKISKFEPNKKGIAAGFKEENELPNGAIKGDRIHAITESEYKAKVNENTALGKGVIDAINHNTEFTKSGKGNKTDEEFLKELMMLVGKYDIRGFQKLEQKVIDLTNQGYRFNFKVK